MSRRTHHASGSNPYASARRGVVGWLLLLVGLTAVRGDDPPPAKPEAADRPGYVVVVPLPITNTVDLQVQRMIDQVLEQMPANQPAQARRPVLVLEFRPKSGQHGEGTDLARAGSLAKYLTSSKLSRVQTVAWLPTSVHGHAVLPVLACEEIIMHPNATLGDAGHDVTHIDADMQRDYESIALQRRTIPLAVVRGMLDKQLAVAKVQTLAGVQYVLSDELEKLKKDGSVKSIDTTVKDPGQAVSYSGHDLRLKYGFVSHLASDRLELAAALNLPATAMEDDPAMGRAWQPVIVRLDGPIRTDKINFIIRSLDQRLQKGDVNFVCLEIDSAGGSLTDTMSLAQTLVRLQQENIRTVAFVPHQARGDAALLAVACDHLVMAEGAQLGGPGESVIDGREREDVKETIRALMTERSRSWSLPVALIDREFAVARYVHEGDQRVSYFSEEELAAQMPPGAWKKTSDFPTQAGLTGAQADEAHLARFLVRDFEELKQIYHLEEEPERLHANWAHLLVEQLANPRISSFLLFIAFFALMFELMTPGIGLPGFVSAVCFLLFFWAQVLHGTAGALEIVLFVGGLVFLAIELFAMPGFGVFGVGGILMIVSSVVLASQTFVIPRNAYQLEQVPQSFFMVTAAGAGVVIALTVFRRYISKAPILNRMLLPPPEGQALSELSRRESMAQFDHLLHKRGTTLTPLTPSGKARFGDEYIDVVSDGDFLPAGGDVYVIETTGNRVVVRAVE
jgi:membrane-bound serine protease (ClpP class)